MLGDFLSDLTGLPEKAIKGLGPRVKVEFLASIGALAAKGTERDKLKLFFEIRNQCAHNDEWKKYRECLNDEQFNTIKKLYPSKTATTNPDRYLKKTVSRLCIDAYNVVVRILKVLVDDTIDKYHEVQAMTMFVGFGKALEEETEKLTNELKAVYDGAHYLPEDQIIKLPEILRGRIMHSVAVFKQAKEQEHLGHLMNDVTAVNSKVKASTKAAKRKRRDRS